MVRDIGVHKIYKRQVVKKKAGDKLQWLPFIVVNMKKEK